MQVVELGVGARGFDGITKQTATSAAAARAAGFTFVMRYLGTLDAPEVGACLGADLRVGVVTYGRTSWTGVGAAMGASDGQIDLLHLHTAGIASGGPIPLTVWIDLEGVPAGVPAADLEAWIDARAAVLVHAGFRVGLYVGASPGLTAEQLFARPQITRYWKSLSRVPEPECGWCLLQLFPTNQNAGGTNADLDIAQQDWEGRSASVLAA